MPSHLYRDETATLTGHQKYIHAISHCPATGLVASASEDGSVRLWDARQRKPCTATLVPSTRSELARGKCGQWVGAVCLTSDWVVSKEQSRGVMIPGLVSIPEF